MLARRNRPGRQVMSTTAEWLTSLGMSEYAERFAENDIDFTILGDLTDPDLEKIGVASLGRAANCFAPLPISRTSRRANPVSPLRL
jgi:SAM domain (Sterile alpha motif)